MNPNIGNIKVKQFFCAEHTVFEIKIERCNNVGYYLYFLVVKTGYYLDMLAHSFVDKN